MCGQINVEIVKRSETGKFVVLPRRWIVERTIAWLNRCRRLAKDWECLNRNGLAFLRWASVRLMVRKLCQERNDPGWTLKSLRRFQSWPRSPDCLHAPYDSEH